MIYKQIKSTQFWKPFLQRVMVESARLTLRQRAVRRLPTAEGSVGCAGDCRRSRPVGGAHPLDAMKEDLLGFSEHVHISTEVFLLCLNRALEGDLERFVLVLLNVKSGK